MRRWWMVGLVGVAAIAVVWKELPAARRYMKIESM